MTPKLRDAINAVLADKYLDFKGETNPHQLGYQVSIQELRNLRDAARIEEFSTSDALESAIKNVAVLLVQTADLIASDRIELGRGHTYPSKLESIHQSMIEDLRESLQYLARAILGFPETP